jgi:hypothetical protein
MSNSTPFSPRLSAMIGALAAATAMTALAAPAGAAGPAYLTAKATNKPGHETTLASRCPSGTQTVGGGITDGAAFQALNVNETAPFDSGDHNNKREDGWVGTARNLSGTQKTTIRVEAICDSGSYDYRSNLSQVGPSSVAALADPCPHGERVLSGGIASPTGPGQFWVGSSAPYDSIYDADQAPDDGWRVVVSNHTLNTQPMIVYAICAQGKISYRAEQVTLGSIKRSHPKVDCPAGSHVISGGLDPAGNLATIALNGFASFDDGDAGRTPDDGWRVTADNYDAAGRSATAHAICLG